jgi:uncharacterized membrane protein
VGGLGLIIVYIGLAAGPMSVVAPVSGLVSTVLPVAVALAEGERRRSIARRALAGPLSYGIASGTSFGLFFLLIRNAGRSGELWPVAAGRIGELATVLIVAAVLRRSVLPCGAVGRLLLAAAGAGAIDVVANICYVAATRTGMFGLAVVLDSLYPGVTVLLARTVLGERLHWAQRAGLGLAAIGIILVAA